MEINSQFAKEKPCLIVIDEANELDKELDAKIFKSIASKVPIVFTCDSADPVLDDLQYFHKLTTYCGQELHFTNPFEFINQFCSRQNREKLRDFIRPFYLEYFWQEIKHDNLPFERRQLNQEIFDENNSETSQSQTQNTEIFDCDTVRFVPEDLKKAKRLTKVLTVEDYTCNMSPLHLDSKSPTSQSIYDADTQPYKPNLINTVETKQETPQSVYGQEINSGSTDLGQGKYVSAIEDDVVVKKDANVTEDLFIDSSLDLEEVKSAREVIIISSGSTIDQQTKSSIQTRCSSPDNLFSDDDDVEDQLPVHQPSLADPAAILDSPHPLSLPVIKALERCNTKISTPIAELVNGKGFQDSESPIGILSPNFWSETKQSKIQRPEEVFEITKNDVFCNVLRINENNEISPVGNKVTQRPLPKYNWAAFTGTSTEVSPRNETESPSAATTSPRKSIESHEKSQLRTPTSKRTPTTPCRSSSSKKLFKSSGGWLNKYSPPAVTRKTSKTPQNRRKKLETLFNDIASTSEINGQDLLMSPNDLFE